MKETTEPPSCSDDEIEELLEPSLSEQVSGIFGDEGVLAKMPGFERRPEQSQMAQAVAQALEHGEHLVVEAGTGVGKSLAYLIPAVLYALKSRYKAIICTHTINLQEQLLHKDLPLLQGILGVPFSAVLLKGRQNYLCPARLQRAMQHAGDLFTPEALPALERLRLWSETTTDGTLSDLPEEPDPQLWAQVCSERSICTPKTCGNDPRCFYQVARRRAISADILILNHTLFFTLLDDAKDSENGFLFSYDFVIFDEAHTMESIAARHFGITVGQYALKQQLHRLYNPRTYKGIFQQLKNTAAITATTELLQKLDQFFEDLLSICDFKQGRECRVHEKKRLELFKSAEETELIERLSRLDRLIEIAAANAPEMIKVELIDLSEQLSRVSEGMQTFLEQSLEGYVYWVEKTGRAAHFYTLHGAPIDMASHLERRLFRKKTSAILTSATLGTGGTQLHYFRSRVGASEVPALQLGSPFDYQEQMKLHLVKAMPDPRHPEYEEALEKWIAHFTEKSQARTFVLFTSYRSMQNIAAAMKPFFAKKKWNLLVQGEGTSRSLMLETFRSGKPCVLFGTDSFWTGVDIPGEALSNVMITRLPFVTPDHPLTEARLEQIIATGGDAFRDYSLPEAILKLRQGVGRLIRNKTDSGTIVILDSRMIHKSYGKAFLKALPECPVEVH